MTMEMTKDQFFQILDQGEVDVDAVRLDYSGRHMYGRSCPGITGTDQAARFMAGAGIVERGMDEEDDGPDFSSLELADDVRDDNMGRSMIYYWPSLELTGESDALKLFMSQKGE